MLNLKAILQPVGQSQHRTMHVCGARQAPPYLRWQKLQSAVLWQHKLSEVAAKALQTSISWHITRQSSFQESSQKCLSSRHRELKGQRSKNLHWGNEFAHAQSLDYSVVNTSIAIGRD